MKSLHAVSGVSLVALIFLCLAWELWLAPLRTGGSWLVLKTLPLLLPLMGILKGRRYTYQWAPMLILAYFTEGVVRAWSDKGLSACWPASKSGYRWCSSSPRFITPNSAHPRASPNKKTPRRGVFMSLAYTCGCARSSLECSLLSACR